MDLITVIVTVVLVAICAYQAGRSLHLLATWSKPSHSEMLNEFLRDLTPRDHHYLKQMHARRAAAWIAGAAALIGSAWVVVQSGII